VAGGGPGALDPDEILISVNDRALTRGEAMRQVQLRLGGPPPPTMPAERVQMIQRQVLSKVIDEFVKRELLLREADRLKIEAPEDEVEKTLAGIRQRTPEGRDPKGILDDGPAGGNSLRNEVVTGIRIEKLLATALPTAADPSEAEIAAFREEHREKLAMPERVHARHILLKLEANATAAQKEAVRGQAEALRQKLIEGADFAALAQAVSACPSAARGGDLGVFPRGKMAKPFEEAAFSQAEGEIGPVVETQFGYHLIRVEKHQAPGLADDEQIVAVLKQRSRAQVLADYVRSLQRTADIKHSATVRPPLPSVKPVPDGK
jgi:peptidyl-prolyl cis-trans isomerase C